MQHLAFDRAGLPWGEFALRFSAFQTEVSCAIVGTASIDHLRGNIAAVEKGPLAADTVAELRLRFRTMGAAWRGEV
jgi:aryl-alcohol dehydrogenase-like predicted oxidoreductase